MTYKNIHRKCSVCQCCGACDYEHEVEELGEISGEYSPMMARLMKKTTKKQLILDLVNVKESDDN